MVSINGTCSGCGAYEMLRSIEIDPHQPGTEDSVMGCRDTGWRCYQCRDNIINLPAAPRMTVDQWTDAALCDDRTKYTGDVTIPLATFVRWYSTMENLNLFTCSQTEYIAVTQEIREEMEMHPAVIDAMDKSRLDAGTWAAEMDAEYMVSLATRGLTA